MDPIVALREEIHAKVREYYRLALAPEASGPFCPGRSKIPYAGRVFDQEELCSAVDAGLDFWLTEGRYAAQLERKIADFLQIPFVSLVNSGSSANLLAFSVLTSPSLGERRILRGDEVITAACAFPTTVAPILQYGAVPVFIDVDGTGNLDPDRLEAAFSSRTKAVMVAHTLGNPFQLKTVKAFCEKHGLWLIEDNCDALGSRYAGRLTGTFGDIGTSSFYPAHHMTTGEGGALYTGNPLLHKIARSLRDWGRDCCCPPGTDNSCGCRFTRQFGTLPAGYDHKYVYSHFGYNLKMTDLQAAIGCAQAEKLPQFIAVRKRNFQVLYEGLKDLPQLRFADVYPESDPAWFGFLISVEEDAGFCRNDLTRYLEEHRIQTRNLFAGNLLKHPCFDALQEGIDYRISGELPRTDRFMNDAFWIGVYPGMNGDMLDFMIQTIREFCCR